MSVQFGQQRSMSTEASNWVKARRGLSIGLEVECFLPDLATVSPREIPYLPTKDALFDMVAERIEKRLKDMPHLGAALGRSRHVSTDMADWGYYWIATKDGSITASATQSEENFVNALPVELVSNRMSFEDCDVV